MKRSQYAMEYLIVVGFSALIIMPVIIFLMHEYNDMQYTVNTNQAYAVASKITDSAMKVYYLGEGSMTTITVTIPQNVIKSSINNNEVLFQIESGGAPVDIYSVSPVNLTGSIPSASGTYRLIIASEGSTVRVGT